MYAVVVDGAKQLRVAEGDAVRIDQLGLKPGEKVTFDKVLLIGEGEQVKVGTPTVKGAKVEGEVVREIKDDKTYAFTYRRRKASSKGIRGHRQRHTVVKITTVKA
ncbi:MAG: 50S ribosomal protein L21 [Planctomycetaceae bacterium]|nr:50S ribosomal protein L21 [Planctomycetaceae bacterium]